MARKRRCNKCRKAQALRGKTVCGICEVLSENEGPGGHLPAGWPMVSLGMSVLPKQAVEANRKLKERGISGAHFDEKGRCHVTSEGARRRVAKMRGMQDNNAFNF
jgi:hypothetical protein